MPRLFSSSTTLARLVRWISGVVLSSISCCKVMTQTCSRAQEYCRQQKPTHAACTQQYKLRAGGGVLSCCRQVSTQTVQLGHALPQRLHKLPTRFRTYADCMLANVCAQSAAYTDAMMASTSRNVHTKHGQNRCWKPWGGQSPQSNSLWAVANPPHQTTQPVTFSLQSWLGRSQNRLRG